MIDLEKQTVIIIDGPMGSGKTTISDLICKKINNLVYIGADKIKWFQPNFKRTDKEIKISLEVLLSMTRVYVENKMNVLITENFIDKNQRNKFISLVKRRKLKLFIYHLHAPEKELLKRITKRSIKHKKQGFPPLSESFITKNLRLHMENQYTKANRIDTTKNSPENIANLILKEINT